MLASFNFSYNLISLFPTVVTKVSGYLQSRKFSIFVFHYENMVYTVQPVLSGPVLNGHPLLSGQL